METAAAAMLEAGVGRFSRAPALAAALLAEMWAPLAVALAALATLPSLLRRLQVVVLRLRSRGREVIQSHISTYYSSGDEEEEDDEDEQSSSSDDEEDEAASSSDDDRAVERIGYMQQEDDAGCFPWGGAVVRTWQGFSGCGLSAIGDGSARLAAAAAAPVSPAVKLWGAGTASGGQPCWWSAASEGGRDGAAAEAEPQEDVVVGWRRDHHRRRRRRNAP